MSRASRRKSSSARQGLLFLPWILFLNLLQVQEEPGWKKQQKRLNKIQETGPRVHGDHGAAYRCKISPLKVVKYSTFVFSGGKQPRELTACIFKQSPAFAPRPQSFSFPTSAPLRASYPPRADVRHFTANAAFVSEFFFEEKAKKKAKKTPSTLYICTTRRHCVITFCRNSCMSGASRSSAVPRGGRCRSAACKTCQPLLVFF